MNYADMLTLPDAHMIGITVVQTVCLFLLIIVGIKLVGRRVFSQRGPQDLVIIVLVAEACGTGLSHQDAGFWGVVVSVITIFVMGYLCERFTVVRDFMDQKPIVLFKNGTLYSDVLEKHMVDEHDLDEVARQKGKDSYKAFDVMMLEGNGQITALCSEDAKRAG